MKAAEHSHPIRPLVMVFAALLVLLGLSAAAIQLPPGPWKAPVGLGIACLKATLIFIYFMRLRKEGWLVRSVALIGIVWLGIALTLILTDYLTRASF
jgi:cytochrome c oxidase subunit 4